jgi:hypothetical protein
MAVLTEAQKKTVPESQQGLPEKSGTGSYPMPDRKHAAIAKAYAKRFASPAEEKRIDAKANKILAVKKKAAQYGA